MFQVPRSYHDVSMKLSETLDEIGVSKRMVLKRRRARLLKETMIRIAASFTPDCNISQYILGSQSEGTTTLGLQSDVDNLLSVNHANVIQDWTEWTLGMYNVLMIQDISTPPGYCLLQNLRRDAPLPATEERNMVSDSYGRILLKNTLLDGHFERGCVRQGPAISTPELPGMLATDDVLAIPLKSWPQAAKNWLDQGVGTWPTTKMMRYIAKSQCFVVGTGCKVSENEEFQWRISTSLAERCLMFNLNITQIRCYILMKMVLKTYINPHHEGSISSFMCKTVLFHCVKSKHSSVWQEGNLLGCLSYCLMTLNNCISSGNCPHFIIQGNNLMAGKVPHEKKHDLLSLILEVIQCIDTKLLGIQIDDLGIRLESKLYRTPVPRNLTSSTGIISLTSGMLLCSTASNITRLFQSIADYHQGMNMQFLFHVVKHLSRYYREGDNLSKSACKHLATLFCTSLGCTIASQDISRRRAISPQALDWISAGLDSDVASSRLKLASVFYCTGNMERTASVLKDFEETFNPEHEPVCSCYISGKSRASSQFCETSDRYDEEAVGHLIAFCVRFLPSEINCAPPELQYEMFRSTQGDLPHRCLHEGWMDWAVIDSLPYFFFLQYKTYRQLHRKDLRLQALFNLVTLTECDLKHRETALNLLGKCMEEENLLVEAFHCYVMSLWCRARNNAAILHICILISKLVAGNLRVHSGNQTCTTIESGSVNGFPELKCMCNA